MLKYNHNSVRVDFLFVGDRKKDCLRCLGCCNPRLPQKERGVSAPENDALRRVEHQAVRWGEVIRAEKEIYGNTIPQKMHHRGGPRLV